MKYCDMLYHFLLHSSYRITDSMRADTKPKVRQNALPKGGIAWAEGFVAASIETSAG